MAQTIKHRRGKLESIAGSVTPINGELIIASGSDLAVHQEGLLFVGVEGNVLTPSNKILTGSATLDVTGASYDHSIDGVPYYETDAKKLTILGKGGNTDVELAHGQIDFNGSGIVSSSAQVSDLAGVNNNSITVGSGSGVNVTGDGVFTLNQSSDESFIFSIDSGSIAGDGLSANSDGTGLAVGVDDSSIEINSDSLRVKALGVTNAMLAGSITNAKLSNSTISGVALGSNLNSLSAAANGGISLTSFNGSATVSNLQLDIDGMTDINAALVDADLIIVDDGASGTNRKSTLGRLRTYMQNNLTFSTGDIEGVTAGAGLAGGGDSGSVTLRLDSGSIAGAGLGVDADGLNVGVDDSSIEINSDALRVKALGITNAMLAGSIANGKLSNSAITIAGTSTSLGGSITAATIGDAIGAISESAQVTGIGNSQLTNSSITISGTSVSLGNSITDEVLFGGTGVISGSEQVDADDVTNFDSNVKTKLDAEAVLSGSSHSGNQTFNDNVTISGDLSVAGTTTYTSTNNVNIGDNILELNFGGSATEGGILVKDGTGSSTTSGSFKWDATNDYWKAGKLGSEAEVITTGNIVSNLPTGVVSGSDQLTFYTDSDNTDHLNSLGVISGSDQVTITESQISDLDKYNNTDNLNYLNSLGVFSGSEQVNANTITNFDANVLTKLNAEGVFSSSAQVTGIGNSQLTNSSITISGTSVSLGSSITDEVLFGGIGIISGSSQLTSSFLEVNGRNVISGSDQVVLQSADKTGFTGATSITTVGTIGTGTWQGTVIASAYLDSDTAHLSGTQTFSGAKSFSSAVNIDSTTQSTSKTTGALIVDGGVGVAKTLNVGEDIVAYASSDERLKNNIQTIENPLEKLSQISGNTFDWNEEKQDIYKGRDYGVIAQEIEQVMPELVDTRDNGYKAVKYEKLVPLLIESIKELQKEIEELKSK